MQRDKRYYYKGKIRGVFSTQVKQTIGTGTTKKTAKKKLMVYVEELDDGQITVRNINSNFVPTGSVQYVERDALFKHFEPEPTLFMNKVSPAMQDLEETVQRGEEHLANAETFSAEYEFKHALRVDEENIRATFGLGLTYLERNEKNKADLVFRRLVKLKGAFEPKHKHMFNEFGIQLRKNGMYVQALKYYSRAFQFAKHDEHLLYNIGRTMFEKGSLSGAITFLEKAVRLRPDFSEGKSLLEGLKKHEQKIQPPKNMMLDDKQLEPVLPSGVEDEEPESILPLDEDDKKKKKNKKQDKKGEPPKGDFIMPI